MIIEEKIRRAEAVIFASGDGISPSALARVLETDTKQLQFIIDTIKEKYNCDSCGIVLSENSENIAFIANPREYGAVSSALSVKKNTPLPNAAMETLAIIAYNQPVSKAFIEQVRGVDSSSSVRTLLSRGLIEEAGRLDIPGRPLSYRTTAVFLRSFSLHDLSRLPKVSAGDGQISADELELKETGDEFDS